VEEAEGTRTKNPVPGVLRGGLHTRVVGRRIAYFKQLSSTQDEVARLAEQGAEDGTAVLAETQTTGRGRFHREWVSGHGNIHMSVLFRPSASVLQLLSIMSGVAVVRAIRKTTGLTPNIKWPNDVRLRGKKVSGILVETTLRGNEVQYAVVGIGVNIALDVHSVEGLADIATTLNIEAGKPVDREPVLRQLIHELDTLYVGAGQPSDGHGPADIVGEWKSLLETLGRKVEVRWGDEVHVGLAEDVDPLGALLLRRDDGEIVKLPAGEVTSHLD
jgi:BirA family biotin operon repressor/biotin-[acetyl-CoA-carboxylase] ligase